MPEGPFGGPRPFAESRCKLCVGFQCVGKPDDEGMRELEQGLRKYNVNNQQDVLIEGGKRRRDANAVYIVIGLPDTLHKQEMEDRVDRFKIPINEHTAEIWSIRYHAGDPHDVLREKY